MLIGVSGEGLLHNDESSTDDKFIPKRPLDKRSSVLESRVAQSRVLEKLSLPRDEEVPLEMPSVGLHQALKGYLLWRALIEQKWFSRLDFTQKLLANFEKVLADEKMVREMTEKKVATLEANREAWNRSEGKWRRELEMREDMIKGLHGHRTKQSTMIAKLKEEIGHNEHDILERDRQIKYLTKDVESEKRARLEAQECAWSDRVAAQNVKMDLQEERSTHKASLATIQALETRLSFLESEDYREEVMEKYLSGPIGKVEMSLACKAGFDYLLALLPPKSRPTPDHIYYPSRVTNCLDIWKEIEIK